MLCTCFFIYGIQYFCVKCVIRAMKRLLAILVPLVAVLTVAGQGTVKGVVRDAATGAA